MLESSINPVSYVKIASANWTDLTDGGETTLHSHAGGSGSGGVLLADKYNPSAIGGILLCSQYDPTAS